MKFESVIDWIVDHLSTILLILSIGFYIFGMWYFSNSKSLKEWGAQPASQLTKGDVLLLVLLLGWLMNIGKGKS